MSSLHDISPGSILQKMYLKERLNSFIFQDRSFIEIGTGGGALSNLLLESGYTGIGFDLNTDACFKNKILNDNYIRNGKYKVLNENFLCQNLNEKVDLIISSMVTEHFEERQLDKYFEKCKELIHPTGRIITLVPAGMRFWGIEDEIAGHIRRYEFEDIISIADKLSFKIDHCVGLTFPISNILFPISNFVVKRNERKKLSLDLKERTILSGDRNVFLKTRFPKGLRLLLNENVLYPFHIFQKMFKNSRKSMVIYFELARNTQQLLK